MERYCLTLDLKDDAKLIAEYKKYHEKIWPEIDKNIRDAGVTSMEIYLFGNRMVMIMEVDDSFTWERNDKLNKESEKAIEWEDLMWKYQQAVPGAKPGEKWVLMDKIFDLKN